MAELTFDVQDLNHIPNAVLVKMAGAIDASTVVNFQSTLENLQLNGVKRFILDMEGIKYVNSTGLGSLVRLADQLESDGGGFALVKIHPKVKVVFDMLGLNAFFKIFPNQEAAEQHFGSSGDDDGGSPTQGAPQPQQQAAAAVPPPPPATPQAPPQRGPQGQAQQRPANTQGGSGTVQPRAIACQGCGVTLRVQQAGNFKCSRCGTMFTVHPTGQVEFHTQQQQQQQQQPREKVQPMQMNMTCRDEYTRSLGAFLGTLAQQYGFQQNRSQQLQQAVNDIISTIRQASYGGNANGQVSVLIAPANNEVNLKFADRGRPVNPQDGRLFSQSRSMMAMFDLKPHPNGGNILTVKMTAS